MKCLRLISEYMAWKLQRVYINQKGNGKAYTDFLNQPILMLLAVHSNVHFIRQHKVYYFILLYVVAAPSGSSVNVISFSEMEILKDIGGNNLL